MTRILRNVYSDSLFIKNFSCLYKAKMSEMAINFKKMSGHFLNSKILTKQHHPVVLFIAKKNSIFGPNRFSRCFFAKV